MGQITKLPRETPPCAGSLTLPQPASPNLLAGRHQVACETQPQVRKLTKPLKRRQTIMSARTPKEVFVMLLSNARNHTERSIKAYETIGQNVENPDVKEALKARAFIAEQNLETLD